MPIQTEREARQWLHKYEESNSDLSPPTRRMLGLFALATKRTPREVVWKILGYETVVFHRDISRRWWLVLSNSECARHWNRFKRLAEYDGVPIAWEWLKSAVSKRKLELLRKRLGVEPWAYTSGWRHKHPHYSKKHKAYWFKMGTWYLTSPWTMLIIEGKTLDGRRPYDTAYRRRLRPKLRGIELECKRLIDPDKVPIPEVYHRIVDHLRTRLGRGRRKATLTTIAWFLTTDVPEKEGVHYEYRVPQRSRDARRREGTTRILRRWA